jgi:predicted nucleic-acid-binding protein
MPVLEVESLDRVHTLITQGRAGAVGLADLWIGLSAREKDCEATLTFDRKAARSGLFEEVKVL